jgi:hypothetical protein
MYVFYYNYCNFLTFLFDNKLDHSQIHKPRRRIETDLFVGIFLDLQNCFCRHFFRRNFAQRFRRRYCRRFYQEKRR